METESHIIHHLLLHFDRLINSERWSLVAALTHAAVPSFLSVSEGGEGGDAPSAGDPVAEQAAKHEAAADADTKPSTTTTGD